MKKTFIMSEVLNIAAFYAQLNNEENKAKADEIGVKVRWALKKAVSTMAPDVKQFEEFRDSEVQKIREEFFSEEKSQSVERPEVDEKGNQKLDEDGNILMQTVQEVKPEYVDDYKKAIDTLNESLNEIAKEQHTYEYNGIDMDAFISKLPDEMVLTFDDLNLLDAVLGE